MARATVVPPSAEYPESDGLPMPDSPEQFDSLAYSVASLKLHYRQRDDVFVGGDMLLYYEQAAAPGETGKSVAPDTFVAFGVPRKGRGERPSYLLWEERKVPDFVLEVASRSTYRVDQADKHRLYERLGVQEYWLYDPVGDYLAPRLQGFRLTAGRYAPIAVSERAEGALVGRSEALDLEVRLYPGDRFRYHDPVTGQDLLSLDETEEARQAAEAARENVETRLEEAEDRLQEVEDHLQQAQDRLQDAEVHLQQAHDRLQEEQATRQALEAQLRDLQRRMRSAGQEPEDNPEHGR